MFAIAQYTVPYAGFYVIDGWVQPNNPSTACGADGLTLAVMANNNFYVSQAIPWAGGTLMVQTKFRAVFGDLAVNSTIRVAVGPNGGDSCDSCLSHWDFTIQTAPNTLTVSPTVAGPVS